MYRRWQPGIGDRNEIAYRIFAAAMISTTSFARVLGREPPAGSLPAGATVQVNQRVKFYKARHLVPTNV